MIKIYTGADTFILILQWWVVLAVIGGWIIPEYTSDHIFRYMGGVLVIGIIAHYLFDRLIPTKYYKGDIKKKRMGVSGNSNDNP